MELVRNAIKKGSIKLDLRSPNLEAVYRDSIDFLVQQGQIPPEHSDRIKSELILREKTAPTAIGHSVAVPHLYMDEITEPSILFVRLNHPLYLGAPDGVPTRFFIFLLGPNAIVNRHLDTLSSVARLMADEELRYDFGEARNIDELVNAIDRFNQRVAESKVKPRPEIPEGLQYTGAPFGGIIGDLKRRLPHYANDFIEGLHVKTISSTLFLYFACIAPAVIFGGVIATETNNNIGVNEIIIGTAVCGIVYALFAGQPLVILGATGPLLIFEVILFKLCIEHGADGSLPFLEARASVGLTAGVILIALGIFNASCLMRYFTRFTDEIFAALIAFIFIQKAVELLYHIFERTSLETTDPHYASLSTALFSLVLAVGTFYLAMSLSRIRRSRYLLHTAREFLADFGPAISLAVLTVVAIWFSRYYSSEIELDTLTARPSYSPSIDRAWLINPFGLELWVWLAAILPGLLLALLVYADQNITARLVNSPDNRLQKGEAYHWDLVIIGLLVSLCSMFGWPWLVAATIRSLNFLRSLANVEKKMGPGGQSHEQIIHVRETRLPALLIHVLIGLSIFLIPLLEKIPMPVLYGLFLFMGVGALAGNQFFERLSLMLMDTKLYPSTHYTRRVPRGAIHRFTIIQLICLVALIAVKHSSIAILFPLLLVAFIPIRFLSERFFKDEYLVALDSDESPEE